MELRSTLLAEHSKANAQRVIDWIGDDQKRFDKLFTIFLSDEKRLVQHAAWPLSYVVIAHPHLIKKHFAKLLKKVRQPGIHDAVKRNTVRLLQDIDIPEKFQGDVMDLCFYFIASPNEKPAIKAFSLTVLQNLAKQYPEIIGEVKTIIEDRWDLETAAFRSRAKKFLSSASAY